MACDLCTAEVISKRYYEDDQCWIADCTICNVPMVVWRTHDAKPPVEDKAYLAAMLKAVADVEFGEGGWTLDDNMRNIPDHYHAHARPPSFWRI